MSTLNSTVLRTRLSHRARVRQIEVFVAIAELAGVHPAAQRLGISQPGATKHLQDLERLLDTPLFLRHARGMTLTSAGQQLLPSARAMLANLDEVAERTAALNGSGRSIVRVCASQGAVASLLAETIPAFGHANPGILVAVRETDPVGLSSLLSEGAADLALGRQPKQLARGWSFTPISSDRLVVIAGPQHPLARQSRPVTAHALAQATWLSSPLDSHARAGFAQLFKDGPSPASWPVMTRSPIMIWRLLRAHDVLALLPSSYMHEFLKCGELVQIRSRIDLPLAPIGVLQAEGASIATLRLADFLIARSRRPPDGA